MIGIGLHFHFMPGTRYAYIGNKSNSKVGNTEVLIIRVELISEDKQALHSTYLHNGESSHRYRCNYDAKYALITLLGLAIRLRL